MRPLELVSDFSVETFQDMLIGWWQENGRKYPWRETSSPDHILLAEVLLHRTRADQVAPAYQALIEQYPTIDLVADADPAALRELLKSLGLRWRVDLLLQMARRITDTHRGRVPRDSDLLQSLPGVGPYIAAAVRCFAYGEAEPILDTNTVRIASRVFDLPRNDSSRRSRGYRELIGQLVDSSRPKQFNYAMLDHGALVCQSRTPMCGACPVQPLCITGRRTSTSD